MKNLILISISIILLGQSCKKDNDVPNQPATKSPDSMYQLVGAISFVDASNRNPTFIVGSYLEDKNHTSMGVVAGYDSTGNITSKILIIKNPSYVPTIGLKINDGAGDVFTIIKSVTKI